MLLEPRAIDRILQRLCMARGGAAARTESAQGTLAWTVEFSLVPGDDDAESIRFQQEIDFQPGETRLICDADLDREDVAVAVAAFQRELATAMRREAVGFESFEALQRFLTECFVVTDTVDGEYSSIEVGENDRPDEIDVRRVKVAREPWVTIETRFADDADPSWLIEKNGLLSSMRFGAVDGEHALASSLPLAVLTGQRLCELIDDVILFRGNLLDELDGGDREDGDDEKGSEDDDGRHAADGDDESRWEAGAIVGPWQSAVSARHAVERELAELGWSKVDASSRDATSAARIVDVEGTYWISGDELLVARLAFEHQAPRLFGVDVQYGESGNRVVAVELFELRLAGDGDLVKRTELGVERVDADALDAIVHGQIRLAERAVGAASKPRETERIAYREAAASGRQLAGP